MPEMSLFITKPPIEIRGECFHLSRSLICTKISSSKATRLGKKKPNHSAVLQIGKPVPKGGLVHVYDSFQYIMHPV